MGQEAQCRPESRAVCAAVCATRGHRHCVAAPAAPRLLLFHRHLLPPLQATYEHTTCLVLNVAMLSLDCTGARARSHGRAATDVPRARISVSRSARCRVCRFELCIVTQMWFRLAMWLREHVLSDRSGLACIVSTLTPQATMPPAQKMITPMTTRTTRLCPAASGVRCVYAGEGRQPPRPAAISSAGAVSCRGARTRCVRHAAHVALR